MSLYLCSRDRYLTLLDEGSAKEQSTRTVHFSELLFYGPLILGQKVFSIIIGQEIRLAHVEILPNPVRLRHRMSGVRRKTVATLHTCSFITSNLSGLTFEVLILSRMCSRRSGILSLYPDVVSVRPVAFWISLYAKPAISALYENSANESSTRSQYSLTTSQEMKWSWISYIPGNDRRARWFIGERTRSQVCQMRWNASKLYVRTCVFLMKRGPWVSRTDRLSCARVVTRVFLEWGVVVFQAINDNQ